MANDITTWLNTVLGITAIARILTAVLVADATACAAMTRNGSWNAAVQHLRYAPVHSYHT